MEKQKLKAIVIGTTGAVGREVDSKDIAKALENNNTNRNSTIQFNSSLINVE